LRIAVQGLGHVGYALAEQLAAAGAELLVSELDPGRLQLAVEQLGAQPVSSEALPSSPCDIFVPCGLGGVLTPQAVAQLHCAVVAGAANNQLASPDVAELLEARGILYAPDYVINSGGLIYVARQHQGASLPEITSQLARIGQRLCDLYGHAQAENCSPARIADQLAERLLHPA
jgi:leucine dehydrogenase